MALPIDDGTGGGGGGAPPPPPPPPPPPMSAPIAVDDLLTANENTPTTFSFAQLLGNDTDAEGDTLNVFEVGSVSGGTVVFSNTARTVTFTPNAGFKGDAVFTYVVTDSRNGFDTGKVTVAVGEVNDAPVAVADEAATDEDTSILLDVLDNDSDADGDTLTLTSVSAEPGSGTVAIEDGRLVFDPGTAFQRLAPGQKKEAELGYTVSDGQGNSSSGAVTVTVTGVNDAPVAAADTLSAVAEDNGARVIAVGDLMGNDTDVDDDDILVVSAVGNAVGGTVVLNTDKTVTFTPTANFNGAASFEYTVTDTHGGRATGTASFTVTSVNDVPVVTPNRATTDENTAFFIDVLGNDSDVDGDTLTLTAVGADTGPGTVTIKDGKLFFDPGTAYQQLAPAQKAEVDFSYTVSDGQGGSSSGAVALTVTGVNDAPVAAADSLSAVAEDSGARIITAAQLLGNDTDIDVGDSLTVSAVGNAVGGTVVLNSDGTVTFTPAANFDGAASFDYKVADNHGGSATASASFTVTSVADAPVAVDDTATTDQNNTVLIDVLGNDTDGDGDTLSIDSATKTSGLGTVGVVDGEISYDPDGAYKYLAAGDEATVTIDYVISDGNGGVDTATATVTVTGVNDDPDAVDDRAAFLEDGDADDTIAGNVLANDTDPDSGDTPTVTDAGVFVGSFGTLTLKADGSYSYAANDDLIDTLPGNTFGGEEIGQYEDVFTYTVSDGQGGTASATLTIDITTAADEQIARHGSGSQTISGDRGGRVGAEDTIYAGTGNDTIYGLDGADSLFGQTGDDKLFGGEGRDSLFGGSGNDTLSGGDGGDLIAGEDGNDRLTGDGGEDIFSFSRNGGNDVITDFQVGLDRIEMDGTRVKSLSFKDADRDGVADDAYLVLASGTVTLLDVGRDVTIEQLLAGAPPTGAGAPPAAMMIDHSAFLII